jgi:hypothetical protein
LVIGKTQRCDIGIGNDIGQAQLLVCSDPPQYAGTGETGDGLIGWSNIESNIMRLDLSRSGLTALRSKPAQLEGYSLFRIDTNSTVLTLTKQLKRNRSVKLVIDTGASGGIRLPEPKWNQWRSSHPDQPATVLAAWGGEGGAQVVETAWADTYTIGPLRWSRIECIRHTGALQTVDAIIGLDALKQMELILDGPHELAYVMSRPSKGKVDGAHNRLGALFMPAGPDSNELVAHVASPSPAQEAGIRPGDLLLKIDDLDVTGWRTKPGILPLARFWQQPSGTEMILTLKRGEETVTKKVVLKNILPPE